MRSSDPRSAETLLVKVGDHPIVRRLCRHPAELVLALNSALIAYWFLPTARYVSLCGNDAILHISVLRQMQEVWQRGGDILDFWSAHLVMGASVVRYGHWLLTFFGWLVHQVVPAGVPIEQSFYISVLIYAALLPWSFYLGARWLGFAKLESVLIPLLFTVTFDSAGYGIGLYNYTLWGHSIVNQGFALLFFPLSLGLAHRAFRGEGAMIAAGIALAATFMSHLFPGYVAALWIALDALLVGAARPRQWRRIMGTWLGLHAVFCVFASPSLYSILQDRLLQHRSLEEPAFKFLGVGGRAIWRDFISGNFLDFEAPFPVITAFTIIGFVISLASLIRRPKELDRFNSSALPIHALCLTALSFGPATWGVLSWLPFSRDIQWHRFIVAAQMVMLFCAGVGLAGVFDFFHSLFKGRLKRLFVAACLAGLFVPILMNRHRHYMVIQRDLAIGTQEAWGKEKAFHEILAFALNHPEGRYYAGHYLNFGKALSVGVDGVALFNVLMQRGVDMVSYLLASNNHTSTMIYLHMDRRDLQEPRHEELLGIRYVILPHHIAPQAGYTPVLKTEVATVYDSGQREGYFMVGTLGPKGCADSDGLARAIGTWLGGPLSGLKIFPAVELAGDCAGRTLLQDVVKQDYRPEASGVVLDAGVSPGKSSRRYWAKVRMDTPGLLVFKMNYHPAWRALVNGTAVETMMVVPAYQAVFLERGVWDVQLEYMPPRIRLVLFAGTVLLAFILLVRRFRSSHGTKTPHDGIEKQA